MLRAISVVLAVLALLAVGWYVGHRPVAMIEARYAQESEAWHAREDDLRAKADRAVAREMVRTAQADLLLAAHEVEEKNFGIAGGLARKAQDHLVRAAALPGANLEVGAIRDRVESAYTQIDAMNLGSADVLRRAAEELRRLLEQSGRA